MGKTFKDLTIRLEKIKTRGKMPKPVQTHENKRKKSQDNWKDEIDE